MHHDWPCHIWHNDGRSLLGKVLVWCDCRPGSRDKPVSHFLKLRPELSKECESVKENDDDHGETQHDHDHVKFDATGHLFVGPVGEASGLLETDGGALV